MIPSFPPTTPGQRHLCPRCARNTSYSYRFDTRYCTHCLVWLEERCEAAHCVFCAERPEKPGQEEPNPCTTSSPIPS